MKVIQAKYVVGILFLALCACNSKKAVPIKLNIDQCEFCKMKVSDSKYGGEIITNKGRVYKFDDIECMISYTNENKLDVFNFYVTDFVNNNSLINTNDAHFLASDFFLSPMRGNIAAFSSKEQALKIQKEANATPLLWSEILKSTK
jgi:copper chaperone NosL